MNTKMFDNLYLPHTVLLILWVEKWWDCKLNEYKPEGKEKEEGVRKREGKRKREWGHYSLTYSTIGGGGRKQKESGGKRRGEKGRGGGKATEFSSAWLFAFTYCYQNNNKNLSSNAYIRRKTFCISFTLV